MIANIKNVDLSKRKLSQVTKKKPDTVVYGISDTVSGEKKSEYLEQLRQAEMYWTALRDFRDRRKKNRKYYRGDQWHETMANPDYDSTASADSINSSQYISEETYILNQGKIPFKQNLIRQMGKSILGQYRANPTDSVVIARSRDKATEADIMSNTLKAARQVNSAKELEARNCEEFMLSGACFTKIMFKYIKERDQEDVWMENKNPCRMYFNNDIQDPRLSDLTTIGQIIDAPLDVVISVFAKTPKDEQKIRQFYASTQTDPYNVTETLTSDTIDNLDFYNPIQPNVCRVFEHWYLKSDWRIYAHDYLDGSYSIVDLTEKEIDAINASRVMQGIAQGIPQENVPLITYEKKKEQFWYCMFLTPRGDCLWEGESPYAHQEHPFVVTLHPLLDGEVWSIVEDVIDQQRYINRLIALYDFIMGASAKGVLMVSEDALGDYSPDEFADKWVKFNSVIVYKQKPGVEKPYQISANSTNIGISEMLNLQMKLFQEITGVSEAIQGQTPKAGTPSSLYAQQASNSMINVKDFFETYAWHRQRTDNKILKVVKQFYRDERYIAINGSTFNKEAMIYDPKKVRGIDFDVVVAPSTDTPTYKMIIEESLKEFLNGGFITFKMYLQQSSLPYADQLLQMIESQEEQIMSGQQNGLNVPPEMMQKIQGSGDPKAQAMIQQMMSQQN